MATIQIGTVTYERPEYPITHSEIEHILAVAGKDVIRIAWRSLAPYRCKYYDPGYRCSRGSYSRTFCTQRVAREDLAAWLCQFFNLKKNSGQGNACINQLCAMGVLVSWQCSSGFLSTYSAACGPAFQL